MLSWGAKRKFAIIGVIGGIFVLVAAVYGTIKLYNPPSCTDGKQNQAELGIDCGGPCARLCENQAPNLIVHWQRSFYVAGGAYNAVAYVENTNPRLGTRAASYVFKLYNKEGILVAERAGVTMIPPQRIIPIFEGDIKTGNRPPFRIVFEFEGTPTWETLSAIGPNISIVDQKIEDIDSLPLITARLVNDSPTSFRNIEMVAIVYDKERNASAASRTVVESVPPLGSVPVLFSWPAPFGFFVEPIIEIVPYLYPGVNY